MNVLSIARFKSINLTYNSFTTESGEIIYAPKVVLTTGTFLQGEIHIGNVGSFYFTLTIYLKIKLLILFWLGKTMYPSGRFGEAPSVGISKTLELAGFKLGRLKTGKEEERKCG